MKYFDSCPYCGFTGKEKVPGVNFFATHFIIECKKCKTLFCYNCADIDKCKSCNYRSIKNISIYETVGKIGSDPDSISVTTCSKCYGTGYVKSNIYIPSNKLDDKWNVKKCPVCHVLVKFMINGYTAGDLQ